MFSIFASLFVVASLVQAGTVLWDGRFDYNNKTGNKDLFYSTVYVDLSKWDWGHEVGSYRYYLPSTNNKAPVKSFVQLSPGFKNPASAVNEQGIKITIKKDSPERTWRTELVPAPPSIKGPIYDGVVFYHFSMMRKNVNAPSANNEHQIAFFESHFIDMKAGLIGGEQSTSLNLYCQIDGKTKWKSEWKADVWHNIAYEIDHSQGTVAFWHSTGAEPLAKTAGPTKTNTSGDREFHLGALRLSNGRDTETTSEDYYFSGVYIEKGSITTSVAGPPFH